MTNGNECPSPSYLPNSDGKILIDALDGKRGRDQARIATVALAWAATLLRKNMDYGSSVWKVPVLAPKCSISDAIYVRMSDKVSRLAALQEQEGEVAESIEDTVSDLGSYCLLWLARPPAHEEDTK